MREFTRNGDSNTANSPCFQPPNHALIATATKKRLNGNWWERGVAARLKRVAKAVVARVKANAPDFVNKPRRTDKKILFM